MKAHEVTGVRFQDDRLVIDIDGREHVFPLADISSRLASAGDAERQRFEVSPSGYGIHWPLIDEDLSVDGLLGIARHPAGKRAHAPKKKPPRHSSAVA